MNVLGISCFFHDSAAALLRDGMLVAAAEEERFSRKKHDSGFPENAIEFCLREGQIESAELDYVVFFEKPFAKFERLVLTSMQTFPRSHSVFRDAMVSWLGDKLWIKRTLEKRLGLPSERILFSEHHISHAASAFFCSPFEDAAILTIDGAGEWTTASIGVGHGNEVRLLQEIKFPHSLGLLYSAFTAFLGFEVNEGEFKVMGMAGFGVPRYEDKVRELVRVAPDGSFELVMDYFKFHRSTTESFSGRFLGLFGPPRDPRRPFFTESSGFPSYFGAKPADHSSLAQDNQRYADIAASIQAVTEDILVRMARHAQEQTHLDKVCLAGGVALNSVANARILEETPFTQMYVQPSAGDGGGALGAALYAWHMVLGRPRAFVMDHAFWGQEHGEAGRFLDSVGAKHRELTEDDLLDVTVSCLQEGKVVGWCQGRFEWGPRALGNRSILADPRRSDIKDVVNTKIKFREPFRPFAPSVIVERAGEYFDIPRREGNHATPFMLCVGRVKLQKREVLPGITHVDGSARVQTVERSKNRRYYGLIERFGNATGVPVLLNTSFNLKGEPIVNTPEEAFSTFQRSGMDVLVFGNNIVEKN